ncbi:hypothetical protein PCE1_003209 [Barthelona sp. PCE]
MFETVQSIPWDPILKLITEFKEDSNPKKVNLGVGAFRTDEGKPYVLPAVQKACERVASTPHEYPPMQGLTGYPEAARTIIFGKNHRVMADGEERARTMSMQTLSGCGSLSLIFELLRLYKPEVNFFLSDPTWPNHQGMIKYRFDADQMQSYRYFNNKTCSLDFEGMIEDMNAIPEGSVILLQACGHNPTGVDPTKEQWEVIANIVVERKLFPIVDCAYQGFVSGSLDEDAFAVRYIADVLLDNNMEGAFCQSFSKNLGLYGERIGALHVITKAPEHAHALLTQFCAIARSSYSMPSINGAKIVTTVFNDPELLQSWNESMHYMFTRISGIRSKFHARLMHYEKARNPDVDEHVWDHVLKQKGMFTYTGLEAKHVDHIKTNYSIYFVGNGRISMSGLNDSNLDYVAEVFVRVKYDL